MKTISISVLEKEYEAYRQAAKYRNRPIAQLIREAMVYYRKERLSQRDRLMELPLLVGHAPTSELPSREKIYDEIFVNDPLNKQLGCQRSETTSSSNYGKPAVINKPDAGKPAVINKPDAGKPDAGKPDASKPDNSQ